MVISRAVGDSLILIAGSARRCTAKTPRAPRNARVMRWVILILVGAIAATSVRRRVLVDEESGSSLMLRTRRGGAGGWGFFGDGGLRFGRFLLGGDGEVVFLGDQAHGG